MNVPVPVTPTAAVRISHITHHANDSEVTGSQDVYEAGISSKSPPSHTETAFLEYPVGDPSLPSTQIDCGIEMPGDVTQVPLTEYDH